MLKNDDLASSRCKIFIHDHYEILFFLIFTPQYIILIIKKLILIPSIVFKKIKLLLL